MNFRPFKTEDADLLAKWINDPDYQSFFRGWSIVPTYEDLRNYPQFANHIVMTLTNGSDHAAGFVVASDFNGKNRTCKAGIAFDAEHQGKGHLKEVSKRWFEYLTENVNIRKVKLDIIDEWLVEKVKDIGFLIEGVANDECFVNGKYVDEYHLAKIKRE